jgi:hypothetical protein
MFFGSRECLRNNRWNHQIWSGSPRTGFTNRISFGSAKAERHRKLWIGPRFGMDAEIDENDHVLGLEHHRSLAVRAV